MTLEDRVRQIVREEIALAEQRAYQLVSPPTSPVAAPPPVTAPGQPAAPPVAAPPVAVPPGPPVVSPPTSPVAAPPPATAPGAPPAPPVAAVPTLDEIRALANDFARAKPQDMHLFQSFMASKGVASLADMPAAEYPACKAELQRLMGVQ